VNFVGKFIGYRRRGIWCRHSPLSLKGITLTLSKRKTKCTVQRQTKKRKTFKKVNISDFFQHAYGRDNIKSMVDGVKFANYATGRKFLIASMLLNSGARTGAVANREVREVIDAEKIVYGEGQCRKTCHVVCISNH
jgi:hypothetical protein